LKASDPSLRKEKTKAVGDYQISGYSVEQLRRFHLIIKGSKWRLKTNEDVIVVRPWEVTKKGNQTKTTKPGDRDGEDDEEMTE